MAVNLISCQVHTNIIYLDSAADAAAALIAAVAVSSEVVGRGRVAARVHAGQLSSWSVAKVI